MSAHLCWQGLDYLFEQTIYAIQQREKPAVAILVRVMQNVVILYFLLTLSLCKNQLARFPSKKIKRVI